MHGSQLRRTTIALFLAGLLGAESAAGTCDFDQRARAGELEQLRTVQSLEVRIANLRRWIRNALDIENSAGVRIRAANRRSFKGTVTVTYPYGQCVFRATIRQNGDFKDHFFYEKGETYSSLDVRLRDGNIAGIVRFKLFRPESRYGINEILAVSLLRELGFLAPRTMALPVIQNGRPGRMLFQEKLVKEFLESNLRREGPLFEGSEEDGQQDLDRLIVVDTSVALARLLNERWAARDIDHFTLAATRLSRLQLTFLEAAQRGWEWHLPAPYLQLSDGALRRWRQFEALLLAMGGQHALYRYNRKFYFDPVGDDFEALYYDGDVRPSQFHTQVAGSNDYRVFVRTARLEDLQDLLERLERLAPDDWASRLQTMEAGHARDWQAVGGAFLAAVRDNLHAIMQDARAGERAPASRLARCAGEPACEQAELDRRFRKRIGPYLGRLVRRVPGSGTASIVGLDRSAGRAQVMHCTGSECQTFEMPWTRALRYLATISPAPDEPPRFYVRWEVPDVPVPQAVQALEPLGLTIRHSAGAVVEYTPGSGQLVLRQSRPGDWFVVEGSRVGALDVKFLPAPGRPPAVQVSPSTNAHGLTGCLTFHGVEFAGTRIEASGTTCEDALNLVGVSGELASVRIRDAAHDALDLDYSSVAIRRLVVERAGNDCVDFSAGDYRLDDAKLSFCVDKAVSVGEAARLQAGIVRVNDTTTGVAVKDSARATITTYRGRQVEHCAEAYRKKQEYWGGRLHFGSADCPVGGVRSGPLSVIGQPGENP